MVQKTFLDSRGREVIIKITDETILFYHGDAMRAQWAWAQDQIERGNDIGEEEKRVHEFYFINKQNWVDDFTQRLDRDDNWHKHMKDKTWFTNDMYEYMNKNSL